MKEMVAPPNLIPDELSAANQEWLDRQLSAEKEHLRSVAARETIRLSQNPRNIRAS